MEGTEGEKRVVKKNQGGLSVLRFVLGDGEKK